MRGLCRHGEAAELLLNELELCQSMQSLQCLDHREVDHRDVLSSTGIVVSVTVVTVVTVVTRHKERQCF